MRGDSTQQGSSLTAISFSVEGSAVEQVWLKRLHKYLMSEYCTKKDLAILNAIWWMISNRLCRDGAAEPV